MPNNPPTKSTRHVKPFWAITAVAVVAAVLGGVVYFYTQGTELQDDIYSISFSSPVQIHKISKTATMHSKGTATSSKTILAK